MLVLLRENSAASDLNEGFLLELWVAVVVVQPQPAAGWQALRCLSRTFVSETWWGLSYESSPRVALLVRNSSG